MDRFVVGTGRCGSTLLSRMLACHPGVLSLSEFFNGLDMRRRFAPELSGPDVAELVSADQPLVTAVLRRGYRVSEVTYPFQQPGARFAPLDPLPWILVATLPSCTRDPDALYDRTLAWLARQPVRPAAGQYRALFEWLAAELGRSRWIERSGSSVDYVAELNAHFPQARFVHIHRDGAEVALSMRDHHSYRLAVALRYDVELDASGTRPSDLGPPDFSGPPVEHDAVSRILASRPSVEAFGRFWSDQLLGGLDTLESIPAERVHTLRFEDLVAKPAEALAALSEFLGIGGGGWIDHAAELVRGIPRLRAPHLPAVEAEALAEACRPARERLAARPGP